MHTCSYSISISIITVQTSKNEHSCTIYKNSTIYIMLGKMNKDKHSL